MTETAEPCTAPPEGWTCSRGAGHEGPCAASPADPTLEWAEDMAALVPKPTLYSLAKRYVAAVETLENEPHANADADVEVALELLVDGVSLRQSMVRRKKGMMDLTEFRDAGYLQEVNRIFFHPLGLALAVDVVEAGPLVRKDTVTGLWGIFDSREDPEGYIYASWPDDAEEKASNVRAELRRHARARLPMFRDHPRAGGVVIPNVQPIGWVPSEDEGE